MLREGHNNNDYIFVLRWRFDFNGNRPSKYGLWSASPDEKDVENHAWSQNKEGLVRASIEAKHLETRQVKTVVECDGHEFVNFQFMGLAFMPGLFTGTVSPVHRLVGITLLTRDKAYSVFHNGMVETRERTEEEKSINFATFGR